MATVRNRENQLARESLFTALMLLMDQNDFEEISITHICKKAGVSRMAYYRNYESKDHIIVCYLDDLFELYQEQIQTNNENRFRATCLYFTFFRQNREFINKLIQTPLRNLLLEKYDVYLIRLLNSFSDQLSYVPQQEKYLLNFFAGGLYKVLIAWVQGGMRESDEHMAQIVYKIMTGFEK